MLFVKIMIDLFFSLSFSAPYLSEQSLDGSLLSQRSPVVPAPACSASSQTSSSSSTSSGPQSTNTTSSSTSSAQSSQVNSTPPSSSSGSQTIGGMKPSSYSPFGTAGLQGNASQNGPQSNSQGAGGLAENGPSANQTQVPAEAPERWVSINHPDREIVCPLFHSTEKRFVLKPFSDTAVALLMADFFFFFFC